MTTLYAACRLGAALEVKHVRVTQQVQAKLGGIFEQQAVAFLEGINEEVPFNGDWKPDADELLTMDLPDEAAALVATAGVNPMAVPDLDTANFADEGIKALFVPSQVGGRPRVLIQLFSAQQLLERRHAFMLQGTVFRELTEPAFTLDNYLSAIIEDGKLKFKSFHRIKALFSLTQFYQEATDPEIETFCAHESIHVPDAAAFKAAADQPIRKMVHAVTRTNVLGNYTPAEILQSAASVGLVIALHDGKIAMPTEKRDIKTLFRFLDDGIYEAPLTKARYMANSKRLFGEA